MRVFAPSTSRGGEATAEESPPAGRVTNETDYFQLADHLPTTDARTHCQVYLRGWLFVGNCRAGCTCEMNNIKAFEANFRAPLAEIRPGIVKRIAEFDEHVQRHEQAEDVLA